VKRQNEFAGFFIKDAIANPGKNILARELVGATPVYEFNSYGELANHLLNKVPKHMLRVQNQEEHEIVLSEIEESLRTLFVPKDIEEFLSMGDFGLGFLTGSINMHNDIFEQLNNDDGEEEENGPQ